MEKNLTDQQIRESLEFTQGAFAHIETICRAKADLCKSLTSNINCFCSRGFEITDTITNCLRLLGQAFEHYGRQCDDYDVAIDEVLKKDCSQEKAMEYEKLRMVILSKLEDLQADFFDMEHYRKIDLC